MSRKALLKIVGGAARKETREMTVFQIFSSAAYLITY
jgi:hypothetical protein